MRPLVALSTDWVPTPSEGVTSRGPWRFDLNSSYPSMIVQAGAVPLALVPSSIGALSSLIESIDLLVLTGGGDLIPPFGPDTNDSGDSAFPETRASWEMALYRAAAGMGVPVLGICLGFQIIAVSEGVELLGDIASELPGALDHHGTPEKPLRHPVESDPSTLIGDWAAKRDGVGSYHHQGILSVPEGFALAARTSDGVIEGFEDTGRNLFAVQWHPEREPGGASLVRAVLERRKR